MYLLLSLFSLILVTQGQSADRENKKQVIVVSLPGESDTQYLNHLQRIADFVIEMDAKTKGRDHLFIIHDKSGRAYLNHHNFINAHLIEVDQSLDLWMRDFPPCMPKQQIKFRYRPQYILGEQAIWDESNFNKFACAVGLPNLDHSDLVLEGGNIVENGVDAAITTERTYSDNPDYTEKELVKALEDTINRKVVVIEDPQDTTGHADGIVSFVEEDVLLISLFDDPDGPGYYESMKNAVLNAFPDITVVPLPCYIKKNVSHGFGTAEGSYANSLVTNNAVYLPFFANQTANQRALDVFQRNTNKDVVPVHNAGRVPGLGGSLRCMTWQIDQDHPVANALFAYVYSKRKRSLD